MFLPSSLRPRQGPSFLLTKKGGKDVPKRASPLRYPPAPRCLRSLRSPPAMGARYPKGQFLSENRSGTAKSLRCVKRSASRSLREVGRRTATRRDCQALHQRRCVKISLRNFSGRTLSVLHYHGGHLSQRERQDGFSGTARLSSLKKELPPGCKFSAIGRCFLCL